MTENIKNSDIFTDLELLNETKMEDRLKQVNYAGVILFSGQAPAKELFDELVG